MRTILLCSLVFLLLAAFAPAGNALPTAYKFTDLGSFDDGDTYVSALNNKGEIIGWSSDRPFIWKPGTGMQSLPEGLFYSVNGINESGKIVGMQMGEPDLPVIWDPVNGITPLSCPDGFSYAWARGLNDIGQATGIIAFEHPYCDTRLGTIWEPDGSFRYIDLYSGTSINNAGQVAGLAQGPYEGASSCGPTAAAMWDPAYGLITIGAPPQWEQYQSFADDINDLGVVSGYSESPHGDRAFLWTMSGGHRELGGDADAVTYAYALNDHNQAVGGFMPFWWAPSTAFVWEERTGFTFLNTLIDPALGYSPYLAMDINDRGWIIGMATRASTGEKVHAFVLRPVTRVNIDIMPGNRHNMIYPWSSGTTSVAVFGSPEVDASRIDPATVRLAGAPVRILGGKYKTYVRDMNQDHIPDMVLQIVTRGMQVGRHTTFAVLEGELLDGTPITGKDKILVTAGL